jgi:hypothetical protein
MLYRLTNFQLTVVKPYYTKEKQVRLVKKPVNKPVNVQRCNRERPLRSRNKPKSVVITRVSDNTLLTFKI